MQYKYAVVKAIKADIHEALETCGQLSNYIDPEAGSVVLDIMPRQLSLLDR